MAKKLDDPFNAEGEQKNAESDAQDVNGDGWEEASENSDENDTKRKNDLKVSKGANFVK